MNKLLIFLITLPLFATDYALIIGIGNYQNSSIPKLKNYTIDITNYNEILYSYNLKPQNIYSLIDSQATKTNITTTLALITQKIKRNDQFFMFFSGHGTSLFDENYSQQLQQAGLTEIMQESGAILPYDFNPQKIASTLVIGKEDFRPQLKKIDDKGVDALIVFDACFSENSIRTSSENWTNRTPNILTENDNYPYENIVYIASSIIQSQSGKFSPILKACLNNKSIQLKTLKECINQKVGNSMQIPAILANQNKVTIFK